MSGLVLTRRLASSGYCLFGVLFARGLAFSEPCVFRTGYCLFGLLLCLGGVFIVRGLACSGPCLRGAGVSFDRGLATSGSCVFGILLRGLGYPLKGSCFFVALLV